MVNDPKETRRTRRQAQAQSGSGSGSRGGKALRVRRPLRRRGRRGVRRVGAPRLPPSRTPRCPSRKCSTKKRSSRRKSARSSRIEKARKPPASAPRRSRAPRCWIGRGSRWPRRRGRRRAGRFEARLSGADRPRDPRAPPPRDRALLPESRGRRSPFRGRGRPSWRRAASRAGTAGDMTQRTTDSGPDCGRTPEIHALAGVLDETLRGRARRGPRRVRKASRRRSVSRAATPGAPVTKDRSGGRAGPPSPPRTARPRSRLRREPPLPAQLPNRPRPLRRRSRPPPAGRSARRGCPFR